MLPWAPAQVKVNAPPEQLRPITLGRSAPLRVGQQVGSAGETCGTDGFSVRDLCSSWVQCQRPVLLMGSVAEMMDSAAETCAPHEFSGRDDGFSSRDLCSS